MKLRFSICFYFIAALNSLVIGSDGFALARHVTERKDDSAFENDKVTFRIYGPALKESTERSGVDCLAKLPRKLKIED